MNRLNVRFLVEQSVAFILLIYFALIGGSPSGIWFYTLRRLSVIILAVIVAAWCVFWAKRGFPFPRTRLDLVWALFVLAQVLATVFSVDPRRSMVPLALTISYWLIFYLVVDLLRGFRAQRLLASSLLLLGVVLVAFGVIECVNWYRGWWEIGGWRSLLPPVAVRLQSLTPHANSLAAYMNVLFPFGVAAWVKIKSRLARIALALWLAMVLAMIFLTSSRGGWIGTAVALPVLVSLLALDRREWVVDRWQRLRHRPAYLGVVGLLMVAVLVAVGFLLVRQAQHPTHGRLFDSRQWLWDPVWATFVRYPLWGAGPATYPTRFLQAHSVPPQTLYYHAHSLPFNTLLESGLVGLLALVAVAGAVVCSAVLQWRAVKPGVRSWLIAAIAALIATMVHSLFDTPQVVPGFSLLVVLVLALVEGCSLPPARWQRVERVARVVLGLAWPVLIVVLLAGLASSAEYALGVGLANGEQYDAAVPLLDRAATRDPLLAANWFQAAYVHAMIGFKGNDAAHLRQALEGYRAGLALEPSFAANWADLGVLLWHMGDEQGAREALQQAAGRAPREAAFILTLGAFEEEMENPARAMELYTQGLEARSAWADSYFFRATPLRVTARKRWLAGCSAPAEPLQACWEMLRAGELDDTHRCLLAVRGLHNPNPSCGLSVTDLVADDLTRVERDLRVTAWLSDQSDLYGAACLYFALGDVLAQRGDLAGGAGAYERALARLNDVDPAGGVASGRTTGYIWVVFNREAIIDHFLPGVVWLNVTDDVAGRMLRLGAWYEQLGQTEDAACMYRDLLEAAPDVTEAEERLRVLESR